MKQRLFNLAAAASLLLAIAMVVLWVRSYGRCEAIGRRYQTSTEIGSWHIGSSCCALGFTTWRQPAQDGPSPSAFDYVNYADPHEDRWFPFPPVRFLHFTLERTNEFTEKTIAYWLLLPPTLVLPAIALATHRRRRRRRRNNLCPTCGYDRRAQTPTDRCPECGSLPSASAG